MGKDEESATGVYCFQLWIQAWIDAAGFFGILVGVWYCVMRLSDTARSNIGSSVLLTTRKEGIVVGQLSLPLFYLGLRNRVADPVKIVQMFCESKISPALNARTGSLLVRT